MSKGIRRRVLGTKISVNLNNKKGYAKVRAPSERNKAIAQCAKGKDLAGRKACFKTGSTRRAGRPKKE